MVVQVRFLQKQVAALSLSFTCPPPSLHDSISRLSTMSAIYIDGFYMTLHKAIFMRKNEFLLHSPFYDIWT